MIKQFTALEHKIGDRIFHLMFPPESPLGEIHDSLVAMKELVMKKILELHEQTKPKSSELPKEEPPKEEPPKEEPPKEEPQS